MKLLQDVVMSTVNMTMKSCTFSHAFLKMLQSFIVKENCVSNLQKRSPKQSIKENFCLIWNTTKKSTFAKVHRFFCTIYAKLIQSSL